jgi:catechol 2,3-dioxygenase-like lactoylglutathione lyase family enzyme
MPRNRDCIVLHVDLFVRSMDRALDFYCDKLGFSVVDNALLSGAIVRRVSNGVFDRLKLVLLRSSPTGAMIELQEFQPESALVENASSYELRTGWVSILVPDVRALIRGMADREVCAASEIFTIKLAKTRACEAVFYKDPDGNDLEFLQISP